MTIEDMLDLLDPVHGVSARRMFGGCGFYKDGVMFALEADGRLYLKVDDLSRQQFAEGGGEPFIYITKDGRRMSMSYHEPPESALASPLKMKPWALLGVQASQRAALKPGKKKKPRAKKRRSPE